MSIKNNFLILIICSIGFLGGYFYISKSSQNKLDLDRRTVKKMGVPFGGALLPNNSNLIKISSEIAETSDENATVKINLILNASFDLPESLNYQFKLGENVALVEGDLEGTLAKGLKQNVNTNLSISVRGYSTIQNRHILFEIFGKQKGKFIRSSILLASDKENTFENTVQNVEKIKASSW